MSVRKKVKIFKELKTILWFLWLFTNYMRECYFVKNIFFGFVSFLCGNFFLRNNYKI